MGNALHISRSSEAGSGDASVILCGYDSPLYRDAVPQFNRIRHQVMTRGGMQDEVIWHNYELCQLHDYRFVGVNFRDRERIRRRQATVKKTIESLPTDERLAMLQMIEDYCIGN